MSASTLMHYAKGYRQTYSKAVNSFTITNTLSMNTSLAEVISSKGEHDLSNQAKKLLEKTIAKLKRGASSEKFTGVTRGLVEANGKIYILVDYLRSEYINPHDEYSIIVERQGRVFELTLNNNTLEYDSKIIFRDQWKVKWQLSESGEKYPASLEDYTRGLKTDINGEVFIYGRDGNLKGVNNTRQTSPVAPEKILNKLGLSAQDKSGFRGGNISRVTEDDYHGNVIALSTYSGANSFGDIRWPEFVIVSEKGNDGTGNIYTFPKSQNSDSGDIIISGINNIYSVYEGFEPPLKWNPMSANAYYEVKNPQKLTRISKNGRTETIYLPGVNNQMNTSGKAYSWYHYDLTEGAKSQIWVIENRYDQAANRRTSAISMRAWKADRILKDKNTRAEIEMNFQIPKKVQNAISLSYKWSNRIYMVGETLAIHSTELGNREFSSLQHSLYDKIKTFYSYIYGIHSAAKKRKVNASSAINDAFLIKDDQEGYDKNIKLKCCTTHTEVYNPRVGRYGIEQESDATIDLMTGAILETYSDYISHAENAAKKFIACADLIGLCDIALNPVAASDDRIVKANGLETMMHVDSSNGQYHVTTSCRKATTKDVESYNGSCSFNALDASTTYHRRQKGLNDTDDLDQFRCLVNTGGDNGFL